MKYPQAFPFLILTVSLSAEAASAAAHEDTADRCRKLNSAMAGRGQLPAVCPVPPGWQSASVGPDDTTVKNPVGGGAGKTSS